MVYTLHIHWFDKAKVYKINTNVKLSNGNTRIELYNERFKLSENLKPVLNQKGLTITAILLMLYKNLKPVFTFQDVI